VNDSVKQAIALVGISCTRHAGRAQAIEQNCCPTYSKLCERKSYFRILTKCNIRKNCFYKSCASFNLGCIWCENLQ